jgi:hypothetical protein
MEAGRGCTLWFEGSSVFECGVGFVFNVWCCEVGHCHQMTYRVYDTLKAKSGEELRVWIPAAELFIEIHLHPNQKRPVASVLFSKNFWFCCGLLRANVGARLRAKKEATCFKWVE